MSSFVHTAHSVNVIDIVKAGYLKGQFVFILSSVGEQGHITLSTFNKTEASKPKTTTRLIFVLHFVNTVQRAKNKDMVKQTPGKTTSPEATACPEPAAASSSFLDSSSFT